MKLRALLSALVQPPLPILIAIASGVWLLLLALDGPITDSSMSPMATELSAVSHAHHHAIQARSGLNLGSVIEQTVNLHWLLMLIAMMLPLLSDAIMRVWRKNFPHKRYGSVLAFLLGYAIFWTGVGTLLFGLTAVLMQINGNRTELVMLYVLVIAAIWQASPWKQACLNRCHRAPTINPFGFRAELDSFGYGLKKAGWCVGTCWALMWLSLLIMQYSMWFMPLFTLLMFIDQTLPWQPERWQMPYQKLLRQKARSRATQPVPE